MRRTWAVFYQYRQKSQVRRSTWKKETLVIRLGEDQWNKKTRVCQELGS